MYSVAYPYIVTDPSDSVFVFVGPGPNAYALPSLTGYPKHDISKWRNPAYTMGIKHADFHKTGGAGFYPVPEKYTRFGKAYSPTAPFGIRHPSLAKGVGPGPNAYSNMRPKMCVRKECGGGTFGIRPDQERRGIGPGPNEYSVNNSHLKRTPAFALGVRPDMIDKRVGPGPNAYNIKKQDKVKTVKFGPPPGPHLQRDTGPGPGAHQSPAFMKFNQKANPPKFAFGMKTGRCPYITPADNADCTLICK